MNRHITNFDGRSPLIASSTLSSTVRRGNRLVTWNVRAMPSAVRRWLCQPVTSWPNSSTWPDARRKYAGDQVEQRGLAGAVRPDDRLAVAGHDLERDAAHGMKAAEALRQPFQLKDRRLAVGWRVGAHVGFLCVKEGTGASMRSPGPLIMLVAELAGRIVAAVDRRRQELVLLELPELIDVRIGLDDGVPELFLVDSRTSSPSRLS